MNLTTNIPENPMIVTDNNEVFNIGDRVRIQFVAKKYPEYPYSGGGIICHIKHINRDNFIVDGFLWGERPIYFDEVYIIKKVDDKENFNTVPYINDEEREFWCTHWITKDGIKKKTAEDLKMLEEFNKEWKK